MIALLRAAHAQPALAVTAVTTALAVSVGRGAGAVAVAVAVLAGQLSVGWSNDYLDRERDRVVGRSDKPIVAAQVRAEVVGSAALVALVVCVPLSMLSGWRAGLLHLAAVGAAWAYNGGIKATVASPVPYLLAFGSLPAFVTLGLPDHPLPPWWAMVAGALLGTGAHFVNTLADVDGDLRVGVRGLPQRLGPEVALWLGAVLLATATLVLAVAPPGGPSAPVLVLMITAGVFVAGVLVSARHGRPRDAWSLTIGTAVIAVVVLLVQGHALA